jgi:hypothetical protein
MEIETIVIKGQDGKELIINKKDFNKQKHELYKKVKKLEVKKKRIKKEDK